MEVSRISCVPCTFLLQCKTPLLSFYCRTHTHTQTWPVCSLIIQATAGWNMLMLNFIATLPHWIRRCRCSAKIHRIVKRNREQLGQRKKKFYLQRAMQQCFNLLVWLTFPFVPSAFRDSTFMLIPLLVLCCNSVQLCRRSALHSGSFWLDFPWIWYRTSLENGEKEQKPDCPPLGLRWMKVFLS